LGTLLSQRIAEIVMGFGEVWILSKRLFEPDLSFSELFGTHQLDALIIDLYWLSTLFAFQRGASRCAPCTESCPYRDDVDCK
jgi:hypothetical protein